MKTNNNIISVDAMLDERFGKVGKFISDARKSESVSQAELAVRVGADKKYIRRMNTAL